MRPVITSFAVAGVTTPALLIAVGVAAGFLAHEPLLVLLVLTTAAGVGLVATAWRAFLPWTMLLAAAPGLVSAGWLAGFPPSPTRLRTVGWTLVTTSAAAALILARDQL